MFYRRTRLKKMQWLLIRYLVTEWESQILM